MTLTSAPARRRISLPKALPHQLPILLDPARFKVVVCGRRWGKTATGLLATVRGHGPERGARKGAIDGGKVWWVAPDYPTAAEIWRDLKRATRDAWIDKDEVERRVELPGGGSITVKSAHHADSLVAVGLDGLVVDEAGKVASAAWHESLRPTLSDRNGWAVFIGTPKGHNWFHDLYEHAGRSAPEWARWQRPTWDNPLIPAEEIESARRDAPRHFGQEYGARFQEIEGAEWSADYFGEHVWADHWPGRFVATVLALDPAQGRGEREKGCYAAFALLGLDEQGTLWADAWMSQTWDAAALVTTGLSLYAEHRPTGFVIETNGGQGFLAELFVQAARQRGVLLPLHGIHNHEDKVVRIRSKLGPFLAQKRLRFRRGSAGAALLVQQLRDFPVGEYVDGPDALQMAVVTLDHLLSGTDGGPTGLRV